MPSLDTFLPTIKDGMAVRASVPLVGSTEHERWHCFYGKGTAPNFFLSFPDGSLPEERVDKTRNCLVAFDFPHQSILVTAIIQGIEGPHSMELIAKDTVTHSHTRNFFRMDASTPVAAFSCSDDSEEEETNQWRMHGDTIDLSGGGLLCSFSDPLPPGTRIKIELTLPTRNMELISAQGHVVRCSKINEELYHIAIHFDLIDSENQDKIMACCFELQRRYLRMRVRLESLDTL